MPFINQKFNGESAEKYLFLAQSDFMNQISLFYYKHNSNVKPTHISKRPIPYYDLTIVEKGVLYYVVNDAAVALNPGDFILMRPGEYRQRLDSTVSSSYVSFNFSCDMDLQSIPTVTTDALNTDINILLTACDNFYSRMPDNYPEKISYILGALLLYIREEVANLQMNPLALKIKNYILKNYTEKITLQSISVTFHFSASYCNNIFKKETQIPIVDFLIEERIRNAKEQLIHTNLSLPEIASKIGYEDYNYFSRLFKNTPHTPHRNTEIGTPKFKVLLAVPLYLPRASFFQPIYTRWMYSKAHSSF